MTQTTNLELPYLDAAQAQKHVTHNDALRALDAVIQIAVHDRDLSAPPGDAAEGLRYLVAAGASGAWSGEDGKLAAWQDGAWLFYPPRVGWIVWVADEATAIVWDGSSWQSLGGGGSGSVNPVDLVGVNATADATNRLSVSSPASLFNHEGDDHRQIINKASSGNTASQLYQTAFSGRAEIGLTGDDDFHFKVSPDGTTFHEAIVIDRNSGGVSLPHTSLAGRANALINGAFAINQRQFTGGALAANTYGFDRWKAGAAGADITVANGVVTLMSGELVQVVEAPDFAGRVVTLSVSELSGGDLNVSVAGQSAVISSGAGRRGVTITVPANATGDVDIRLSPVAGSVSFQRVKLETGGNFSSWDAQTLPDELRLCQRYYERMSGLGAADRLIRRGFGGLVGFQFSTVPFLIEKRAAPSLSLVNLFQNDADQGQAFNASRIEFEYFQNITAASGYSFFGYEADAEL